MPISMLAHLVLTNLHLQSVTMLTLLQLSRINEVPVFESKKLGTVFMSQFSGDITLK